MAIVQIAPQASSHFLDLYVAHARRDICPLLVMLCALHVRKERYGMRLEKRRALNVSQALLHLMMRLRTVSTVHREHSKGMQVPPHARSAQPASLRQPQVPSNALHARLAGTSMHQVDRGRVIHVLLGSLLALQKLHRVKRAQLVNMLQVSEHQAAQNVRLVQYLLQLGQLFV